MSVPAWLEDLKIPTACLSNRTVVEENGRRFVLKPRHGTVQDKIWTVHVDECWFTQVESKRVDYLFWANGTDGRTIILLVELKGRDFKKALEQIESTLARLCKYSDGRGIHSGNHLHAPQHLPPTTGGVRAYVVLSQGNEVALQQAYLERLRKKYHVLVTAKSQQLKVDLAKF